MAKHRKTALDLELEALHRVAAASPIAQSRLVRVDRVLSRGRSALLARMYARRREPGNIRTAADLRRAVAATRHESHFFDRATMHHFGSKVHGVYGAGGNRAVFVTSERQFNRELPHRYSVRVFDGECIRTVSWQTHTSRESAANEAQALSKRMRGIG